MHHAYCLVGDFDSALAHINEDEQKPGLDVSHLVYAQLGIAEARALKEMSAQRPVERAERVFIVSFTTATLEAQNALLKLFEEPALTTKFYIIVPTVDILIPTLRSRLMIETLPSGSNEHVVTVAQTFLKHTYAERLALIASKVKAKDDGWVTDLLRGLEIYVEKQKGVGASELLFVETYTRGSGASKKMLLEHLALSL